MIVREARERRRLRLAPALPRGLTHLRFRFCWRGHRLKVEVTRDRVACSLPQPCAPDASVRLRLYGDEVTVRPDRPVSVPLRTPTPLLPEPAQPPGYELRIRGRAPARS